MGPSSMAKLCVRMTVSHGNRSAGTRGAVARSDRSALDVGQLLGDLAAVEAEQVDPADMAAAPRVAPALDHTVAAGKDLLDLEVAAGVVEHWLPGGADGRLALEALAVGGRGGVVEDAVVGDQGERGVQIVLVPRPVELLEYGEPVGFGHRLLLTSVQCGRCPQAWPQ